MQELFVSNGGIVYHYHCF